MGTAAGVHSADGWAAYIIDELRSRPLPAVDSYYKTVFGAYLDHAQEQDTVDLDREQLARYLKSEPADADQQEQEEAYWRRIQGDFTRFLQEDYATGDRDAAEPADQPNGLTMERLYTPGACAVDDDTPPSVRETTWLTSIFTAYREDDENDEVWIHHVAYLDEDDARTAVQHLLANNQTDTVERVLWKSIRRGYDAPMQGFAEELVTAGESAAVEQVLDRAEDRHYTAETGQIRDALADL